MTPLSSQGSLRAPHPEMCANQYSHTLRSQVLNESWAPEFLRKAETRKDLWYLNSAS